LDAIIPPGSDADDGLAFRADAPEHPVGSRITIPVVGIGASAGGLEAFKDLVANLPDNTGLAIVFVQHLDPKHRSQLPEILGRATNIPVLAATDGMGLEANHVYTIPANVDLTIENGKLKLARRAKVPRTHMPIDRFLRSLADECGSRAIGVILSGAGSDGSVGMEAIKAAGGVTFAQDLASAKFQPMPQAAVATGCVDSILTPEGIASELARIGQHPYIVDAERTKPELTDGFDEKRFESILAIVYGATGIDFSLYRQDMVRRRILRRLALRGIRGLAEYSKRLENDSAEMRALQKDLLISVTSFFRDPASLELLKRIVFPRIVEGKSPKEAIRIWVAGCATGEEAYSIAILLSEFLHETSSTFQVQIFASDVRACSRYS